MGCFDKLHSQRAAPGLEWWLLRQMPRVLLGAVMVPALVYALGAILLPVEADPDALKALMSLKIFSIAVAVTIGTAVLTTVCGCVIVVVMKGPGYVADGYSPDDPDYADEDRDTS